MNYQPKIRAHRLPAAKPRMHRFASEEEYLAAMIQKDKKRGQLPKPKHPNGGLPRMAELENKCLDAMTDEYVSPLELAIRFGNAKDYVQRILNNLANQGRVDKRDARSYRRSV